MKLRRSFSSHQLLFALGISLSLVVAAVAQDKITTKDGHSYDGKIVGVSASGVQLKVAAGTMSYPLATVATVSMPAPAEFTAAKAAYDAKDYSKALEGIKAVTAKYSGLPTPWADQASSLLGDIYLAMNKVPEAEAAYAEYQKAYGGKGGSAQLDVGLARVAISKKDYAKAKEKLQPIVTKALGEKYPSPAEGLAYSQAFYLLGQVNEAEKDYPAALQNYLRTVTLFYHDGTAVAAARERADALRKNQSVTVP